MGVGGGGRLALPHGPYIHSVSMSIHCPYGTLLTCCTLQLVGMLHAQHMPCYCPASVLGLMAGALA